MLDLGELVQQIIQYIPLILIGFVVLPSIVYYISPQRKTAEDKLKLFFKMIWLSHAFLMVPIFIMAILAQAIDFWFWNKVAQTWNAKGVGGMVGALAILYFYFISYLSIFVGPLIYLEKKLGQKVNKISYAVAIVWFWATLYVLQQLINNFGLIADKLIPIESDVLSQWLLVGFIILTTITISFLNKGLWADIKAALSSKKK